MYFSISAPSKTFLVGEYNVLKQSNAILINTLPRFELHLNTSCPSNTEKQFLHIESPAAKFMADHKDIFESLEIKIIDPLHKLGGFGASSAEFLMVYYFYHWYMKAVPLAITDINEVISTYRTYAWQGRGYAPSGADVISQLIGGITIIENDNYHQMEWPFQGYSLLLAHTLQKQKTHEHLNQLDEIPEHLNDTVVESINALKEQNPQNFIDTINRYQNLLEQSKLIASFTTSVLTELRSKSFVCAAKGCGAMGADVVLAMVKKENKEQTIDLMKSLGLKIIASENDLSHGATMQIIEI